MVRTPPLARPPRRPDIHGAQHFEDLRADDLQRSDAEGQSSLRCIEYEQVMNMTIKTESPATRDLRRLVEERENTK